MAPGRLKKIALGLLIAGICASALGLFLSSNPMIDVYLDRARSERTPEDAVTAAWHVGDFCVRTGRHERAAAAFRICYERGAGDERRPAALLRLAQQLEECGRRAEAADLYDKFLLEYPLRPEREEARRGLRRLRGGP